MTLTEKEIFEKVANQELTVDEALDLIAKLNAKSMVESKSRQRIQVSTSSTHETEAPPRNSSFSEELQSRLTDYIKKTIQPLIPASDDQDLLMGMNFMDLGLDSIRLTQLTQQFEEQFEIELYPTVFFEYQNIEELAKYLSEEHSEAFERYFNLHKKKAPEAPSYLQTKPIIMPEPDREELLSDADTSENSGDIAVIGMAGIFAGSSDLNTFWENLRQKKDLISEIPLDHFDYRPWFDPDPQTPDTLYCKWGSFIDGVDTFDAGFFNISPREAEVMDPQLRLLLQILYTTAEDAGYPSRIRGTKTGIYVGVCCHDYQQEMYRRGKQVTPHDGTGNAAAMIANRPSFYFNVTGPSIAVDTACSSSLVALHLACKALQNNECVMAFAAGTNLLLSSWHYRYFCRLGALTHTGRCHTFDKLADGYIPGEGVGALLLKPLHQALTDGDQIHAVIKGSAINHGGYTPSVTAPSVQLESQVILDAWQDAGIDPRTLGYIEAHGTGTTLGDPVEINGLKRAFQRHDVKNTRCAVGSAKAHIGHTEGAAGIAGVLKVILSMKHQAIPAMPMFEELNPYIQLNDSPLYINQEVETWQKKNGVPRRAGVSSFGFGGAYAHVVLEEYEDLREMNDTLSIHEPQIIMFSAGNEERLKEYAQNIVHFLEKAVSAKVKPTLDQEDLSKSLQKELVKIACDILKVSENDIDSDGELNEYGFEPVSLAEFCERINEKYNLEITSALFSIHPSIGSLADSLSKTYLDELSRFYQKPFQKTAIEGRIESKLNLAGIAYTLQTGREAMPERLAMVVSSIDELIEKLTQYCQGKSDIKDVYTGNIKGANKSIELLISGRSGEQFVKTVIEHREITRLAQLWVSGIDIDWTLLYPESTPNRISLPTYPFAKKRYWIPEPVAPPEIKQRFSEVMYYQSLWESWELKFNAETSDRELSGNILIFDTNQKLFNAFGRRLQSEELKNSQVILVKPGKSFRKHGKYMYEIRPDNQHDYQGLINTLIEQESMPNRIIHYWSQEHFSTNENELKIQLNASVYSILYLTQALMKGVTKSLAEIFLLYLYNGNEDDSQPQYASLSGVIKSIMLENSRFLCKTIGIDNSLAGAENLLSDMVIRELSADPSEDSEVRYAAGERFVKQLCEFDPEQEKVNELALKKHGVYLITGGMGALGLIFADYLTREFQANLILTGRSELTSQKEARLKELERSGSQVIYLQGNVSQQDDVRAVINQAKAKFKTLNGIIHCAGIARKSLIQEITREEISEVLAPKVEGTIFLDKATENEALDFFVLFSSISAETESLGLAGYAYANSFMDNYATRRESLRAQGKRFGKTLSINWPLWKEGGMQIDEPTKKILFQTLGMIPLQRENGLKAFVKGLTLPQPRFLLVEGDRQKIKNTLGVPKRQIPQKIVSLELSQADKETLIRRLRTDLLEIVSKILKIERSTIDPDENMSEYGFDSITLTEFAADVNEKYHFNTTAPQITPAILLEYSSIALFADYLFHEYNIEVLRYYQEDTNPTTFVKRQETPQTPVEDSKLTSHLQTPNIYLPDNISNLQPVDEPIAIIGLGGYYPFARNLEEFWSILASGENCFTEIPAHRWDYRQYYDPDPQKAEDGKIYCKWGSFIEDADKFDPLLFNIPPLEAKRMTPEERLMLQTVWLTLEDGGYKVQAFSNDNVGVFIGVSSTTYSFLGMNEGTKKQHIPLSTSYFNIPNRVSHFFNFRGPSLAIDTACSSSLVAIHMACKSLKDGECKAAIAGGVNLYFHPSKYLLMCQNRMLSTRGNYTLFEKDGDGFIPGEGVGAILLKPLNEAIKDRDYIYGVIKASAVSHNGKSTGYFVPSPQSQTALLQEVIRKAGVNPRTIGYIELQATGSAMVNAVEWRSAIQAYQSFTNETGYCAAGSVTPVIGHLEAASGIAHVTAVLLQMKYHQLTPTPVAVQISPDIQLENSPFYLQKDLSWWNRLKVEENGVEQECPRRAGISSFGGGGVEAHLIIEEYEYHDANNIHISGGGKDTRELIVISARSKEQLHHYIDTIKKYLSTLLSRHLEAEKEVSLADIAFTLQIGREEFEQRFAVLVETTQELLEVLTNYVSKGNMAESLFVGSIHTADETMTVSPEALDEVYQQKDLKAAAQLWVKGVSVDWMRLRDNEERKRIPLPTYPFEKRRCWLYAEESNVPLVPPGSAEVADYYNELASYAKSSGQEEDEIHFVFAPFLDKVDGYSWLLTSVEPEKYRSYFELTLEKQRELKETTWRLINFDRAQKILDIGCGLSTDLIRLVMRYPHLKGNGYTISSKQAELGKQRIRNAHLEDRIQIFCKDSSKDPFPDIYDLIIGFEVTFHIENKHGLFKNISEHLHKNGYLVLADIVANTVTEVDIRHLGQYTPTQQQFSRILAEAGLKVVDCVDVSEQIANYLYDPDIETHLSYLSSVYPQMAETEKEHRGFDRFGKALQMDIFRYLLLTVGKAAEETEDELIEINQIKFENATPYPNVAKRDFEVQKKSQIRKPPQNVERVNNLSKMRPLSPSEAIFATARDECLSQQELLQEIEKKIVEIVGQILEMKPDELDFEAKFAEFGVNSLMGLKLVDTINRKMGLELKIQLIYDYSNIRDLSRYLAMVYRESLINNKPGFKLKHGKEGISSIKSSSVEEKNVVSNYSQQQAEAVEPVGINRQTAADTKDIAIIGLSGRFPNADNVEEFWKNLAEGKDSVTEVPQERWNPGEYFALDLKVSDKTYCKWGGFLDGIDRFDPLFFDMSEEEAAFTDPQQRLFLEETWRALEEAGYANGSLSNKKCGLFIGATAGDYLIRMRKSGKIKEEYALFGNLSSMLLRRLSHFLDLKGPHVSLDSACSSSLMAIHLACRSIISGECDMAIAGGVFISLTPNLGIFTDKAGLLSHTGKCKTFDAGADGFVFGEAVGTVILKSLKSAIKDSDHIYGIIKGSAMNQNGRTNGIIAPSVQSQKELALSVYKKANIDPETITYVETNGLGSKLEDAVEVDALTQAFRKYTDKKQYCAIGSVETNIGHAGVAAGIVNFIKTLLALKHKKIPASLHFDTPNEHIDFQKTPFYVNTQLSDWNTKENQPRRAAVSSFGISGTNVHLVVEEAPERTEARYNDAAKRPYYLITLSAKDRESLDSKMEDLEHWFDKESKKLSIKDIAYTLHIRRSHFSVRAALVAKDLDDLQQKLKIIHTEGTVETYVFNNLKDNPRRSKSILKQLGKQLMAELQDNLNLTRDEYKEKMKALADLYVDCYDLPWADLYTGEDYRTISMPTYPFSRKRYWITEPKEGKRSLPLAD